MQRIIRIKVTANRAKASAQLLGTEGEVGVTALKITFDESWDGLTKKLIWRAPNGSEMGYEYLSAPDAQGVYTAVAPGLPLSSAGVAELTLEGCEVENEDELVRCARSVKIRFEVEPNDMESNSALEGVEASVIDQMWTAINGKAAATHTHTKSSITDFAHGHTKSDISDFTHTHTKSDVTDFAHTHTKSGITDFAHTHTKSEISDFAHTHSFTASDISYSDGGVATTVQAVLDGRKLKQYAAFLSASAWSGSTAPFTQTLSDARLSSGDNVLVGMANIATDEKYKEAAEACMRFDIGNGTITATAFGKKPTQALPIIIWVIS